MRRATTIVLFTFISVGFAVSMRFGIAHLLPLRRSALITILSLLLYMNALMVALWAMVCGIDILMHKLMLILMKKLFSEIENGTGLMSRRGYAKKAKAQA